MTNFDEQIFDFDEKFSHFENATANVVSLNRPT